MAYLVIARKYRPQKIEDVLGQDHVTKTLTNAINLDKVHHAYIFTGPRGVGKTSVSRLLAKALNCEKGVTAHPCGVCKNCVEIEKGISLDVKEIDGASNRGIDEIRDLRDGIKFSPVSCRKKIYIIDEVHMLTNQAFNALLKTLEEPPEHALFIFATTEINEVPGTILSRCQRHDFKRASVELLSSSLKNICDKEGISIDEESLLMIARAGDGSFRDSQSILDQVIAYCGLEIKGNLTAEALGIPAQKLYIDFFEILKVKESSKLIDFINSLVLEGIHLMSFLKGLIEFFRHMMILKSTNNPSLLPITKDNIMQMSKYVNLFEETDFLFFLDLISQGVQTLKNSSFQRIDFEIILMKIFHYESITKLDDLLTRVSMIEGEGELDLNDILPKLKNLSSSQIIEPAVIEVEKSEESVSTDNIVEDKNTETLEEQHVIADSEPETDIETDTALAEEEIIEDNTEELPKTEDPVQIIEPDYSEPNYDEYEDMLMEESSTEPVVEETSLPEEKEELSFNTIVSKWKIIAADISESILSLGKMWDFCVPVSFEKGELVVKFDPTHKSYKLLCDNKINDIKKIFVKKLNLDKISIKTIEDKVEESERIIHIEMRKYLSADELKDELVKKSPQLEFLFEDPINCRVVK